mmetsp:Transcript_34009/g.109612  ORF Transcript_34009/g.109612 Transcript_34009/m.109612 type:complete len:213 (+) Transcript_34009:560-1198(+)
MCLREGECGPTLQKLHAYSFREGSAMRVRPCALSASAESSHLRSGARAPVRVRLFLCDIHVCRVPHDTMRKSHVPSRSARAPRASVQDAWPHESGSRSRLGWPHRRRKTRQDRRPRGRHRLVLLLGDRRVEGRVDDDAHAARDGDRQRARPKHVRADDGDGDDPHAGARRHGEGALLKAAEHAVLGACPLGEGDEGVARLERLDRLLERFEL